MLIENKHKEIAKIWKDNRWLYGLVGFLLGLLFFPFFTQLNNFDSFIIDLVPEAVGILFTVLVIERIVNNLEEKRLRQQNLERLIRDIRNLNKPQIALDEAAENAMLHDGSFRRANLREAVLSGVDITYTSNPDLIGVHLQKANLEGSHFVLAP